MECAGEGGNCIVIADVTWSERVARSLQQVQGRKERTFAKESEVVEYSIGFQGQLSRRTSAREAGNDCERSICTMTRE